MTIWGFLFLVVSLTFAISTSYDARCFKKPKQFRQDVLHDRIRVTPEETEGLKQWEINELKMDKAIKMAMACYPEIKKVDPIWKMGCISEVCSDCLYYDNKTGMVKRRIYNHDTKEWMYKYY